MRIKNAHSLSFAKWNASNINVQEKQIKINHYQEFALKTFTKELPYCMQLPVRLKNPKKIILFTLTTTSKQSKLSKSKSTS